MKKLSMLGIIGGAALLTAVPFSIQWSQKNVALSLGSAEARVGRPLTATSVAGVSRRAQRRAVYVPAYTAPYSYSYSAPYRYGYSAPAFGYSSNFGYTRAQRCC